jgi:pyruvate/2-oxoglutarate dehydrogenase complex dihydrolipoamide acyltransferase (E2) component
MPKQVLMPQLGESVVEGTLTKWLKGKGDHVEEYEPLLEINTDKVDTEVPSPAAGVLLDILVPEGTTIQAGALLAWIGEPGERLSTEERTEIESSAVEMESEPLAGTESPAVGMESRPAEGIEIRPPGKRELGFISPLVKRMARENNIDLQRVPGSGLGGRITKEDVQTYLEHRGEDGVADAPVSHPQAAGPAVRPEFGTGQNPYPAFSLPGDEILPLTPVRRSIAEHMVYSERISPHVTTVMEADLSQVTAHRQTNKDAFASDGANLTFTAYFAVAATTALKAYPIANSSWGEQGVILHHTVNLGIATSLGEAGLIVPVIRGAEGLSLLGMARAINDLTGRARSRQLKPDEVKGGTFTITNHGVTGSLFAAPIINQPQGAILGVGAIQKRVVVVNDAAGNDAIAIRPMVYLSLTFDHRILDGAMADNVLGRVVELLENWD